MLVIAVLAIGLLSLNLRIPTSATGPLLPTIGADTGHGETVLSLLTTIPLILVFVIAPITPRITGRFGRSRVIGFVLVLVIIGTLVRSVPGDLGLFAGTIILGIGIALGTVLGPAAVAASRRAWRGWLTATYTMTLSLGPALALGLTIPMMTGFGLEWRGTLLLWGLVGVFGLAFWIAYTRMTVAREATAAAVGDGVTDVANVPCPVPDVVGAVDPVAGVEDPIVRAVPVVRDPRVWGLAVYLGTTSLIFYVSSTWLPTAFAQMGLDADAAGGYTSLISIIAIPCAFLAPLALRRGWGALIVPLGPVIACVGVVLLLAAEAGGVLGSSVLLGIAQGICLGVSYGLVVEFATSPEHAASVSAVTSTVGIALAAGGPLAFGLGLELTGSYVVPMVGLGSIALLQAALGLWTGRLGPARRGR
ncbi:MFS transporter [Cumulibacter soli]|uniref:MFS transporter n=1 Tax=Cumulibacter soli TaxID=2546344 RepID=UPI00106794D3|nr:MFS transporter [Cumulibacter soli]